MQQEYTLKVEDTNEEALMSKISAVRKGYFKDDFAQQFVNFKGKRDVIIHRGYWARFYLFWNQIENFLSLSKESRVQIVSLGAGLDTFYFNLVQSHKHDQRYIFLEVDLPVVVQKKIRKIQESEKIQSLLKGMGEISVNADKTTLTAGKGAFSLRACDLTDLKRFDATLAAAGIDYKIPTLFFCECVVSYIEPNHIDELFKFMSSRFDLLFFLSYEMFNPTSRFGEMMLKNFADRGIPLVGMEKYPSLEDQKTRLSNAGFKSVQVYTMLQIYNQILDKAQRLRIEKLEPIDQFEEWNIMMSHYFGLLAVGFKEEAVKANPLFPRIIQKMKIRE